MRCLAVKIIVELLGDISQLTSYSSHPPAGANVNNMTGHSLSLSLSLTLLYWTLSTKEEGKEAGGVKCVNSCKCNWLTFTKWNAGNYRVWSDQDKHAFKSFVLIITVIWHRPVMVVTERMIGFEINSNFYTSNSEKMF